MRLPAVRDDQQRRRREPHRRPVTAAVGARSSSASTVTRTTASPGSATGAAAAIAAKRGTGLPPVSALPTCTSRKPNDGQMHAVGDFRGAMIERRQRLGSQILLGAADRLGRDIVGQGRGR